MNVSTLPSVELRDIQPLDAQRMRVDADGSWALLGGKCENCGKLAHPFHRGCSRCGGTERLVELEPIGEVRSSTTVHVTRPDVLLPVPYQVALVQLREGPVVSVPSLRSEVFHLGETVLLAPVLVDTLTGPRAIVQAVPLSED